MYRVAAGVGQAPEELVIPIPGAVSAATVCWAASVTAPGVTLWPEVSERLVVYSGSLGRARTPELVRIVVPGPHLRPSVPVWNHRLVWAGGI